MFSWELLWLRINPCACDILMVKNTHCAGSHVFASVLKTQCLSWVWHTTSLKPLCLCSDVFGITYFPFCSDVAEMTSRTVTSYSGVSLHYLNLLPVKLIHGCRVSRLEQRRAQHSRLHYNRVVDVIVSEKSVRWAQRAALHPDLLIDEV